MEGILNTFSVLSPFFFSIEIKMTGNTKMTLIAILESIKVPFPASLGAITVALTDIDLIVKIIVAIVACICMVMNTRHNLGLVKLPNAFSPPCVDSKGKPDADKCPMKKE